MNINLDKNFIAFFSNIIAIIASLCIAYIPLMMFLNHHGLENVSQKNIDIKYYRLNINKIFIKPPPKVEKVVVEKKIEPVLKLTQFVLKAIYFNENQVENTFIILYDKKDHKQESMLLSINEKLQDIYTFIDVKTDSSEAIFEKDDKRYTMQMEQVKNKVQEKPKPIKEIKEEKPDKNIDTQNSILSIPKEKILKYRNDYKSIWKQISIKEVMENGKIIGFRIRKIKENTLFSKLGLKKGDIITAVNNKPLKSYGDAFKIYYNIDSIRRLKLSISRGSETKEIDYEVY